MPLTVKKENFLGELTANVATPTVMYHLPPGETRIDVVYPLGTTGSVTPKQTKDPNNTTNLGPIEFCGEQIVLTNTNSFSMKGPCWVCFIVDSFAGTDPIIIFGTR